MSLTDPKVYQLVRLALAGRAEDVHLYIKRLIPPLKAQNPKLAEQLRSLLETAPSPWRQATPVPVDSDSRLNLVRVEPHVTMDQMPILDSAVSQVIEQILRERGMMDKLLDEGVVPTRSVLFEGPPGVGKTMTARWIAAELDKTLVTLDLSAVMSSFLGKTGENLRNVLDYAKQNDCILLLDEFDAIAKRRDDDTEIGELKRLVTVLLQEVDQWPETGLLIAATNHGGLLDPAVWRRFDVIASFPMPAPEAIEKIIELYWGEVVRGEEDIIRMLSYFWRGYSPSDISRGIANIRRKSLVFNIPSLKVATEMVAAEIKAMDKKTRKELVPILIQQGFSKRDVTELTGMARNTVTKVLKCAD